MANETVLFRLGESNPVARLALLPGSLCPTFPHYLHAQQRCIDLVRRHTLVPVPVVVQFVRSVSFGIQAPPESPDDAILFKPLLRRLLEGI